MWSRVLAVLVLFRLLPQTGCVVHVPPRQGGLLRGPASAAPLSKLLLLPATCVGEDAVCARLGRGLEAAVGARASLELEARGYSVLRAEAIHLEQGERKVVIVRTGAWTPGMQTGSPQQTQRETREHWTTWNDAGAQERRLLQRALGMDGLVAPSVHVVSSAGSVVLDVAYELRTSEDQQLVWRAHCVAVGEDVSFAPLRADEAGRCAGLAIAEFAK